MKIENIAFYQRSNQRTAPNTQCIDTKQDTYSKRSKNGRPTFEYQVLESMVFKSEGQILYNSCWMDDSLENILLSIG